MSAPTVKLPRNADELLRDFPLEPDFEAQAMAIEARLKGSPGGVIFDDLLRAPELPPESGEPVLPSFLRATSGPKSSFAEMARKSVAKGGDDAAAANKELLAATAHSRRPSAEMVERVRAAGKAASTPLPKTEPRSERHSGIVPRDVQQAVAATPRPSLTERPARDHRGVIIGVAGVVVAIAASFALYRGSSEPHAPASSALPLPRAEPALAPATLAANSAPTAQAEARVLSPEALALAPKAPGVAEKPAAAKAPSERKPLARPPASSPGAKPEAVQLEEEPAPSHAVAEQQAELAPEPAMKPAEGKDGSVPLSPSAGAVSTALGSVRGGAQACLAGQTEAVTATVTFAADGHVLRVSAGGPSGACIQAALSKARIAPFAKESFSATTSIRPP